MFLVQVRDSYRKDGRFVQVWSDVGSDLDFLSALERGMHACAKYHNDIQIWAVGDGRSKKDKVVARLYK